MKRYLFALVLLLFAPSPVFASPATTTDIPADQIAQVTQGTTQAVTVPGYTIEFGKKVDIIWQKKDANGQFLDGCHEFDYADDNTYAIVDSSGSVQLYKPLANDTGTINSAIRASGDNINDIRFTKNNCGNIVLTSKIDPNPRAYEGNEYINPYTTDGVNVYSIMHTEYHAFPWFVNPPLNFPASVLCPDSSWSCWWNYINLAVSTDGGAHFNSAASPNQSIANTSVEFNPKYDPQNGPGMVGIFNPTNVIEKDENGKKYYYTSVFVRRVPFDNYVMRSCLMRTDNLADPSSWKFWDGNGFNVAARGIPATGDCVSAATSGAPAAVDTTIFGNLHWSTYLNEYVNASIHSNTDGNNIAGVRIGPDLKNWVYQSFKVDPATLPINYLQFIQPGAETRSFEDIGRSPWLYFTTCGGPDCPWLGSTTGRNFNIERVRVRFDKTGEENKYDVLDFHFNEYKGTKTLDSSFYGNDGLLYGGGALQSANKYIHFDGTGWVNVKNDPSLNLGTDVSIEARIKTTQNPAAGTFPIIVQKAAPGYRNYGLFLENGGKAVFSFTSSNGVYKGGISNRAVNDNAWHDILVTYTGSTNTVNIYIDGVLDNSVSSTGPISGGINSADLTVGNQFVGDIDKLTVYNYPLPAPSHQAGDYTGDGHVTLDDYTVVKNNFGHPYTIFDYNQLVENFGK